MAPRKHPRVGGFPTNPGHARCDCAPTECADAFLLWRDRPLLERGILTIRHFERAYGPDEREGRHGAE